jgi:DnaK suppressor protein
VKAKTKAKVKASKIKSKIGKVVAKPKTTKLSKVRQPNKSKAITSKKMAKKKIQVKKFSKPKVITNNKQPNKPSLKSQTNFMTDEYMNTEQRAHFRAILLRWKMQIMEKVDNTKNHMQEEVANYPDPIDRANHEEEFNLELRTRDRERKLIHKIDDALGRLNDGDYGYCDACGAEIGVKRLEARPTATQCIECKKIAEVREKQTGEGVTDF